MKNSVNSKKQKTIELTFEKILKNNRKVFYDVFLEALEDMALAKAMQEGGNSKKVSKQRIYKILARADED